MATVSLDRADSVAFSDQSINDSMTVQKNRLNQIFKSTIGPAKETLDQLGFMYNLMALVRIDGVTDELKDRIQSSINNRAEIIAELLPILKETAFSGQTMLDYSMLEKITTINKIQMEIFASAVGRYKAAHSEGEAVLGRLASKFSNLTEQNWQEIKAVFGKNHFRFSDSFKAMAQRSVVATAA